MASKINLSVIVPAYNEQDRLGPQLGSVLDYLDKNFPSYELIIVDDGSKDQTAKSVAEAIKTEKRSKLISYSPNRGKGFAVRTGVLASHGENVLFMDADLSTPLSEIPRILELLENADIVIGSRGRENDKVTKKAPLFRQLASRIFDQIKYLLVGLRRFKDTQCGFKAFKGDVARKLFSKCQIDRFMFDAEVLYLAEKSNLKILEMPVSWADMPGSTVRFWEGIYYMFRDLWRIRYTNKYD
jgi:dolichyl-phosphate beta-glucosyltransferase